MDGSQITELGVGGLLALLVLREVFGFVKPVLERRRNGGKSLDKPNGHLTTEQVAQIADLHRLMTKTDVDGTPLVFVPRSLVAVIQELSQATQRQITVLERLDTNVTEARREIRRQADA